MALNFEVTASSNGTDSQASSCSRPGLKVSG